jgi:hypothetical protein
LGLPVGLAQRLSQCIGRIGAPGHQSTRARVVRERREEVASRARDVAGDKQRRSMVGSQGQTRGDALPGPHTISALQVQQRQQLKDGRVRCMGATASSLGAGPTRPGRR